MTLENLNYISAQAKILRAMYYFYLAIIFDRPILYNEFSMPNDLLEDQVNANQSDLWQQIETDINFRYFSPHINGYRNWEANPSMYYEFETDGAPAPLDRDPRCYASLYFDGDLMDFDPDSPYYVGYRSGLNNI